MILAGAWYVSPTFWTAPGTVAVVVMGVVATGITYMTWRKGSPIRRIGYRMSAVSLLQDAAVESTRSLQTTWNDNLVTEPQLLRITLISQRRQYVGTDDGKPLEFRVNAKILKIIQIDSDADFRAIAFQDDILRVGPAFIGPQQSIELTLLANGKKPVLTPPPALHLDIKELSPTSARHQLPVSERLAAGTTAIAIAAVLVLAGFLIHQPPRVSRPEEFADPQVAVDSRETGLIKAATADLQSGNSATQLDGISALLGIMKTSPSDQPAAILALTKYVRTQSPAGNNDKPVTPNVQAALNALRMRNPADDGDAVIDLDNTNLTMAVLPGIDLSGAGLINADFNSAQISRADFRNADLSYAFFGESVLARADFAGANLDGASFYQTAMCNGSTPVHADEGYNCSANG
jgi:hypothetical protein